MGDAEHALPPSKKRAAGREISKDNPGLDDEEDSGEQETGTFKRASDEVLASRRILKVRRNQPSSTPSSNPFAGIQLVPPTEPTTATSVAATKEVTTSERVSEEGKTDSVEEAEKGKDETSKESESKVEEPVAETAAKEETTEDKENDNVVNEATKSTLDKEKAEEDDKIQNEKAVGGEETLNKKAAEGDKESEEKDSGNEKIDPSSESTRLSSFQQLSSSQNAFTGLAGTGFSTSTFTFGSIPNKDGSPSGPGTGSLFGQKTDQASFGFGLCNNGNSSIFQTTGPSIVSKNEGAGFPSMQEVPVETGEENERVVFSADSVLFEFFNGVWKERGKGELKINVSTTGTERARLLMRARGNYRLILNASLYSDMKLTNMDKRGITFACINSTGENKDGLSTFALKFKDGSIVEEFRTVVEAHKGKTATDLKTPENSPKASDD